MTARLKLLLTPLALAGALLAAPARADDTPIVHAIPTVPLTAQRATAGGIQILLDTAPPASVQFYFDVPIAEATAVGMLKVWPRAEDPGRKNTCTTFPGRGQQTYRLGMSIAKEADSTPYLRATVPPLQVGQPFCFSISLLLTPSADELKPAADQIIARITDWGKARVDVHDRSPCDFTVDTFRNWLATALKVAHQPAVDTQLGPAAESLSRAFAAPSVNKACASYLAAKVRFDAELNHMNGLPGDDPQIADAKKNVDAAKVDLVSTRKAFEDSAPGPVGDAVRNVIAAAGADVEIGAVAGYGTTPSALNYGSVDAGVFVAFPSGAAPGQTEIWLVPYLGLNLYATAVDRKIALSQLTGSWCQRWIRQRASLTIGVTLSTPSLTGRTITAPLLGRYPVLALGYRMTSYSRVTVGGVFYDVADANPASAKHQHAAAPFAGVSLDFDLINLLTQAKP